MKASFHPEAEAEHLRQIAYYEARQRGLGVRYLAEVTAALEYVCDAPHRFPVARAPAMHRFGLRRFPFTLLFRELSGVVQVVAIAPASSSSGLLG